MTIWFLRPVCIGFASRFDALTRCFCPRKSILGKLGIMDCAAFPTSCSTHRILCYRSHCRSNICPKEHHSKEPQGKGRESQRNWTLYLIIQKLLKMDLLKLKSTSSVSQTVLLFAILHVQKHGLRYKTQKKTTTKNKTWRQREREKGSLRSCVP